MVAPTAGLAVRPNRDGGLQNLAGGAVADRFALALRDGPFKRDTQVPETGSPRTWGTRKARTESGLSFDCVTTPRSGASAGVRNGKGTVRVRVR